MYVRDGISALAEPAPPPPPPAHPASASKDDKTIPAAHLVLGHLIPARASPLFKPDVATSFMVSRPDLVEIEPPVPSMHHLQRSNAISRMEIP